ncbi:MAG: LysM peptidoglycan-binding domain-containing protein [Actinomycetota bacterium]|nr:LysM peptidoglycan-binding domain-containing protein [Actinomycetota bacterium]
MQLRTARHLINHITDLVTAHRDLIRILSWGAVLLAALAISIWLSSTVTQPSTPPTTPPTRTGTPATNPSPPRSAPPSPAQPPPTQQRPEPPVPTQVSDTVAPGDTLAQIALRHDVPFELIAARNTITNPNMIRAGRRLTIPPRPSGTIVIPAGATLSGLASRYGVTQARLHALNPHLHNPNRITAGGLLRIAGAVGA